MLDSLLTLDQSTLFYWTLSDLSKKRKHKDVIEWAAKIPGDVKPASHASSHIAACSHAGRSKSGVPSLTAGTSRSSAPSVLTDGVKIFSSGMADSAKVKAEPAPEITIMSDGGLSDNDETNGEERRAAVNSPPKGKKRVNSNVSPLLVARFWSPHYIHLIVIPNPATRGPKTRRIRDNIQKSSTRGTSGLCHGKMVPVYVRLDVYGLCQSNRGPLGCACQAGS